MDEPNTYAVVLVLNRWENMTTNMGIDVAGPYPKCVGLLPVFETREAAEDVYPEAEIKMIRDALEVPRADRP